MEKANQTKKESTGKRGRPKTKHLKEDTQESIFELTDYLLVHGILSDHDAQKRFKEDVDNNVIKLTPKQKKYLKRLLNIKS